MFYLVEESFLECVRERTVTDIVKKDGDLSRDEFTGSNVDAFAAKAFEHATHQVHGTESVLEASVISARVNKVGQPQLTDVT